MGDRALGLPVLPESDAFLRAFLLPVLMLPALQTGAPDEVDAVRRRVTAELAAAPSPQLAACVRIWDTAVALCRG